MRLPLWSLVVFGLFQTFAAQYNPLKDPFVCGLPACTGDGKFKYGPENEQNYEYSVEVRSLFSGTSKNESTLYIEASANLKFPTPCQGVLSLYSIKLSEDIPHDDSDQPDEHRGSGSFAEDLRRSPLRFAFRDGLVSELCPSEEETEWTLNFKRGILNMLHNSMKRFDLDIDVDEEDIRGICPTEYRVVGAKETSLVIEKRKNLTACRGTGRVHSGVQSTPLPSFYNGAKKNSILKSSSVCSLSVDHNIYSEVVCTEEYLLRPFSNYDAGASTVLRQKLSLIDEQSSTQTNNEEEIIRRVPLNFDYVLPTKPGTDNVDAVRNLIRQLCEHDSRPNQKDFSDLFSQFIYSLKTVSQPALAEFYGGIGSECPTGRKHFLDALPYANSGPSVSLMKDIILQGSLPGNTVGEWLTAIAFIPDPNLDIIEAASKLVLQEKAFSPTVAFSVASLIHTFCIQQFECKNYLAVAAVVQHMENYFIAWYQEDEKDGRAYDDMMVTLKALSNIGHLSDRFQGKLFDVIEDPNLDPGMRVAAVETFRRTPCDVTRSYFQRLFKNQDVNAEVRIAAYLQMMRCPNYLLIQVVRQALLEEEVNQVGSFVWTHLKNLIRSSIPTKIEIQSLLSEKDLVRKFDSDVRKFSRNFEGSLYFDDYSVGGSFESNVIFSPSSYIPKSAMLNLSTVLFGEFVNLFEVYGRVDGLEHYFESLFGPNGSSETLKENIADKLRWPRSAENLALQSQVDRLPNVMTDSAKEPKAALGFKVFGNEIRYETFNGENEIRNAVQKLDPIYHLKRILSGKEINYNKATMFLDTKYIIPSGAGLPLSLAATGTAAVNVKIFGSLGSSGFSKNRELQVDLSADVQSQGSVDVTGEMSVDAFYASTGIKLKANLYTDTAIQGAVKIRGSNLVSVNFSLPQEKNEVFVARSEILVRKREVEEPQRGLSELSIPKSVCSWPVVEKTVGLKLCADYKYLNIPKIENIPYFLIAGPADFRYYLHKSDSTAKTYLFEYKFTGGREFSTASLVFDTPGSRIKRLLSANLTMNKEGRNLTMFLESAAGTVLAKGRYKNLVNEKVCQFTLYVDDQEYFDAGASLLVGPILNGVSYIPNVYIDVNRENILKFDGSIDFISKRGISQYTVDLKFDTKRLNSKLFGYISTSPSSLEASLYSDYKFQHMKEQRVTVKFGIANRSRKNIVIIVGFCNLNSSAYPNLNLDGNITFQRSGSHMDLAVKLKQNPLDENHPEADYHTLDFDLLTSYKTFTDNKCTLSVQTSINRKSSNLDLSGEFVYETFRHNKNALVVVRYGDNKKVTATVFWSRPRTPMEQIRAHVNVTIPSFSPMVVKIGVEEKETKYYMIDFHGAWFSGHSMSAVGFYQDKSKSLSSNHHVKLLLRSPSFKDVQLDVLFYHDNVALKFNVEAIHDSKNEYQIFFIHHSKTSKETSTQAAVKYETKIYKFVNTVYDGEYKKIDTELHIDQLRDIHFSVYLLNEESNKTMEFEINWDANRDPNEKLMIAANYRKNADFDYLSNFVISYPGRTVKGDYKFMLERGHLDTLIGLSWDEGKTLAVHVNLFYSNDERLFFNIKSQVNTPLENWKALKLEGKFEHLRNKYVLHGVGSWDRLHKIEVDVFSDFNSTVSDFWCRHSASVISSITVIPNVNISVLHKQNGTNFDTNLYLLYNPEFMIDLDSRWRIDSDDRFSNLTGIVLSKTPFQGMNNGFLASKLIIKDNKYLKGITELDVDHKKVTVNMEGKFNKLTDCMLIINATNLDDDYQFRFIISTEKRHFVAMLSYPTGNLGSELMLTADSLVSFDAKFILATPIEFLQKVVVVAQLNTEQADFRLGWNALLAGFSGVWHYNGITDFHYSYKIYTPLTDFEESYVVAKLIFTEGLDFEAAAKLSRYKLGLKLLGKDKPKLLGLIEDEYDDDLNWKGLIEVDLLIYPTLKGILEVDQKENSYFLQSRLTLPNGEAILIDEFQFQDVYRMKNDLKITTPFRVFQNIESKFELDIRPERLYLFGLNFDYQNNTRLIKTGLFVKYMTDRKDVSEKLYNVVLNINTQYKYFPKLELQGIFESEENFYHANLILNTNTSDVYVDAVTEIDKGLLEFTSNFHIITPSVHVPTSHIKLKKLFSPSNNYLIINLNSPEKLQSDIDLNLSWLVQSLKDFCVLLELDTPFNGLQKTRLGSEVHLSQARSTMWAVAHLNPLSVEMNSTLLDDRLTLTSDLSFNGNRYPVTVDCKILKAAGKHNFDGTLRLVHKLFNITGDADLMGVVYSRVFVKLLPEDESPPVIFRYQITPETASKYGLKGSVQHMESYTNFDAVVSAVDVFNWDFGVKIDTSKAQTYLINGSASSDVDSIDLILDAKTPVPKMQLSKLVVNYKTWGFQKTVYGFFEFSELKGSGSVRVIWNFLENMYVKALGQVNGTNFVSTSSVEAFYQNPQKTFHFVSVGGDANINKFWQASSNVTLKLPPQKSMGFEGHFKVPDDNKETHSLYANVDYTERLKNVIYLLKYRSGYSKKRYGSWGKILTEDKHNMTGNATVEWDGQLYKSIAHLEQLEKNLGMSYMLMTPKYADKYFLVTRIKYKPEGDHHNLTLEAFYPEYTPYGYATIDYKELTNMEGMFNLTVPQKFLNYTGAHFKTKTNEAMINRYLKVFWQGNDAILDSKCSIKNGPTLLDSNTKGKLLVEIPLRSRHVAEVDYEYDKKMQISKGKAEVKYNSAQILNGKYSCVTHEQAGIDRDTIHVELQNRLLPIGADYVHKYEYGDREDDDTTDTKHLHVYHMTNRSKFDVTAELGVHTVISGQEYTLEVSHKNKTVRLSADYNILDQIFLQQSRIELGPSHWLEYELSLVNRTKDEIFDSQKAVLTVTYPKRSFTADVLYNVSDSIALGNVSFDWDEKTLQAELEWMRKSHKRDQLSVNIKHPSFEKDVSFFSEYGFNKKSIDGHLTVDYSLDPNRKLTVGGQVRDNSGVSVFNYTSDVCAEHNATNLRLKSAMNLYWNPRAFVSDQITEYQRSYLPLSTSEVFVKMHFDQNEMELKKDTIATGYSYFWGKYGGEYPTYTANMTSVHDMNQRHGEFFLDFKQRQTYLDMNLTEDGTQSLHMLGMIPDARSAVFDIWRDYDDKRISDVGYYLNLNHSRLIMSNLKWRPELYNDIQGTVRFSLMKFYLDTLEGVNNTKHYIRSETADAVNGIWIDAKPTIQTFLEDLRNITVIEEDIEEFKVFLNTSYHANDFYVKDIINVTVGLFDELAIKSHLQTLPKIIQEVWSIMGESGVKIKKSILWAMEEFKVYYKNTTEFIHGLLNGDPIEHITTGLEKFIEKYDNFIKNLHVSLIQYMENLWSQTYALIVEHWHNTLASLEPTFVKSLHYLESLAWSTGKEFLDFLYLRKNEFIESPYFVKFAKLSHDIDRFYRDVTGNNTIAAVYKYSEIVWSFFREKYLNLVPFGKELMDIINDIIGELKQIGDIPSVKYCIYKWHEFCDGVKYYYNYFDMEAKLQRFIKLIYVKLHDVSITALEIENRQREAKTKFVFEPNDGVMLLEQKLPMSWHAFNETPKFKEIPEIRRFYDLKHYFDASQVSFWSLYSNYKKITDPTKWLPPFETQAMMIGSKYYVTFDKKYYELEGSCTYLLAKDFTNSNFTLLASYDDVGRVSELIILLHKNVMRVVMDDERIVINDAKVEHLPAQFGKVFLYQDAGLFVMHSKSEYLLECNMKFKICRFEMSGWYFGKTAGLWGTYNNEPSDDFLLANRTSVKDSSLHHFANDWSLDRSCKKRSDVPVQKKKTPREVIELCDEFFTSKVSQFSTCFSKVPVEDFLYMCTNATSREEACSTAVAYIDMCEFENMPLRIPDTCVRCTLSNGTEMDEGDFIRYHGDETPKHADVVFILEAKKCNRNSKQSRNMDVLIDFIDRELLAQNISDNRYAVVTFGGDGVFDEPRSVVVDGKTFATAKQISGFFDKIPTGQGSSDMFNGIMFAYDLMFRPGASTNFILIPCSDCKAHLMEYDYSTVHQFLSEGGISLHIIMNEYFTMLKPGELKVPFGIDRRSAYTKRDVRTATGDAALKKSIQLPKSTLGLCLSLALETNGTIFSGKFLESDKKSAKKFATVYAQLVARSAASGPCMDCECYAPNTGVSYFECFLCSMTNAGRSSVEQLLSFEDEEALNNISMLDTFTL